MSEAQDFWREAMRRGMGQTAFLRALGGEIVAFENGKGRMRLPFAPHLVGDPQTRVIHGGVLTAMLDQACGMAIGSALNKPAAMATLDLRIDYMKPAAPDSDIHIESECLKITREVAFARAVAFQASREDPVAIATGTFMITGLTA
ncbi:MAG: PaaI family thioesterase [Alphaproteobacteria bacterium]|nr:PaaI family thioesterase [Alphaproteobacteria bacterium]